MFLLFGIAGAAGPDVPARAGGFKSPEECLAYTGDAHLNCLYAYIEIQQGKVSRLQEELSSQKATAGQLQDRLDRQASVTEHLQDRIKDRDQLINDVRPFQISPFLGFSYSYGYGGPFYYGRPFFYGRRFFGPCYGPFYSYPCW
ncbi:MAG: hypothetical protein ACREJU_17085 [Nitrospiraceae bacterium]